MSDEQEPTLAQQVERLAAMYDRIEAEDGFDVKHEPIPNRVRTYREKPANCWVVGGWRLQPGAPGFIRAALTDVAGLSPPISRLECRRLISDAAERGDLPLDLVKAWLFSIMLLRGRSSFRDGARAVRSGKQIRVICFARLREIEAEQTAKTHADQPQPEPPATTVIPSDELKTLLEIRDACVYALSQQEDDICWMDLYNKLSGLTGIKFDPKSLSPERMLKNCARFVASVHEQHPYVPDPPIPDAILAAADVVIRTRVCFFCREENPAEWSLAATSKKFSSESGALDHGLLPVVAVFGAQDVLYELEVCADHLERLAAMVRNHKP